MFLRLVTVLDFLAGFVLSGMLSVFFQGSGSLTFGGRLAAILIGTLIYGFAGLYWLLLLVAFFISSNFLTSYKLAHKSEISKEKFDKYGPRDFWQVLANGGLATLLAAIQFFYPAPWVFAAFIGVVAFANADTWATELGILSKKKPWLVTNWKEVETGTSGAVSLYGSLVALAGALFIGTVAAISLSLAPEIAKSFSPQAIILIAVLGGVLGSFADSLLGATVQAVRFCPKCKKETERALHWCGEKTRHLRGFEFIDNDTVNLLGSIAGGAAAALAYLAIA